MELILFISGIYIWYIHPLLLFACILLIGNVDLLLTSFGNPGKKIYKKLFSINVPRIYGYDKLNNYFLICIDFILFLIMNVLRKYMSRISNFFIEQNIKYQQNNIHFYTNMIHNIDHLIKQHPN